MSTRRNPDRREMEAARAWGDEGELAYETLEIVRAVIADEVDMRIAPNMVYASMSPKGRDFYARFVKNTGDSRGIALPPSWRSIYVVPHRWINDAEAIMLFTAIVDVLNRDYAPNNFEWAWDCVDPTNLPRLYEISCGPIPWSWRPRITAKPNDEARRMLNFLSERAKPGGWPRRTIDEVSGQARIAAYASFRAFRPVVDAMEIAIAERANILLIGRREYVRRLVLASTAMWPVAERARPPLLEPSDGGGFLEDTVEAARFGVMLLDEVPDYTAAILTAIRRELDKQDPRDRALVVGLISSESWEEPKIREKVMKFGFPVTAEVPDVSVNDLEDANNKRDKAGPWSVIEARERIAARRQNNRELEASMPQRNPAPRQNPWEVRSAVGLEGTHEDKADAIKQANQLRHQGVKGVEVKPRGEVQVHPARTSSSPPQYHAPRGLPPGVPSSKKGNPDGKPLPHEEISARRWEISKKRSGFHIDEKHNERKMREARRNPPEIEEGMARAIFVTKFADAYEEMDRDERVAYGLPATCRGGDDCDIDDIAPPTPAWAFEAADKLYEKFEELNDNSMAAIVSEAESADRANLGNSPTRNRRREIFASRQQMVVGEPPLGGGYIGLSTRESQLPEVVGEADYLDMFGHCLAMQAMGHGVSWFDDHATFPLKFPRNFDVDKYFDGDLGLTKPKKKRST